MPCTDVVFDAVTVADTVCGIICYLLSVTVLCCDLAFLRSCVYCVIPCLCWLPVFFRLALVHL